RVNIGTRMRTDEELMAAYARGDHAAFRELFHRFAPMLLRVLTRHVGRPADAQDLVQQTFLQLHRSRRDYRDDSKVRPWILTIAPNLARDVLRRRGRRPEAVVEEHALPRALTVPPAVENFEVQRRVRAAVRDLPREQREVIELHWFEQLP